MDEEKEKILRYIRSYFAKTGRAPSLRDISVGTLINLFRVHECASALRADGLLEFRPRVGGSYYPTTKEKSDVEYSHAD